MEFILDFNHINLSRLPEVGGKNASLGEMITQLTPMGINVPPGFATTATAYRKFLDANNLSEKIYPRLSQLDVEDMTQLKTVSSDIQKLISEARFDEAFEQEIKLAYQNLKLNTQHSVAVRSSATAEDLPHASFAGQQESYLNVMDIENVLHSIRQVYASLFTERAIAYRAHHGFDHEQVAISVGVQKMIRSDLATSGVMFTMDTESGFDQVVFITASYGLGESIVKGLVNPDEFLVHKPTLEQGKDSIIRRKRGEKSVKLIYSDEPGERVKKVAVDSADSNRFCLNDDEIIQLAKQALKIEKHYGMPMDIEWAKDGIDGTIYIVQARPETVKARTKNQIIERYELTQKATPILSGRSVGQKIGQGVARIIHNPQQMAELKNGEVLVADMTDPDWEPIMKRASAIVTNRGGRTCHAAIVARELGIPAVVGCVNATDVLKDGESITVSCAEGDTGFIYPELLEFKVEKTPIDNLPELPVKLCMNLANPDQAFTFQSLPNDGVGLARLEFIIGNMIGIHPNALLNFEQMPVEIKAQILQKTVGYSSPVEFYIEKLAEGIATIAAAFYPKQVIVRFSDFKSNEYINLLGGELFEPREENPMIGYRGASRYLSGNFAPCFALECAAMKRVREQKGLTNAHVMFPFVRTLDEAKNLTELLKKYDLARGKDGLKVFMMCEIPSNAILAEHFLKYFDGYSIGSNDLTQLTLGLDRDSELVANLFDERDLAVKALILMAVRACRKHNKYIGICGQGPSDHLDLAKWLMQEGIGSMSLTPDSIIKTWIALAKL